MVLSCHGKSIKEIYNLFSNLDSSYNIQVERDGQILSFDLDLQTVEMKNVTTDIYEEDGCKI